MFKSDGGDTNLVFSADYQPDNIILLQLDPEVMNELETYKSVIIKGEPRKAAVLCTKEKTYNIRKAENSNTRLLVPVLRENNDDKTQDVVVRDSVTCHYELAQVGADLNLIKTLLFESKFCNDENDDGDNSMQPLYTLNDLLARVNASEKEIIDFLQEMNAFELNGYYRVLDPELFTTTFDMILAVIVSNSLNVDSISEELILEELQDCSTVAVSQVLLFHSDEKFRDDEEKISYKLNSNKVSKFAALKILKDMADGNALTVSDFESKWNLSLPEKVESDMTLLKGEAIIKPDNTIAYFPSSALPFKANERFKKLFKFQPRWKLDDLDFYIRPLITPTMNQAKLLKKYTRLIQVNNTSYYCAR